MHGRITIAAKKPADQRAKSLLHLVWPSWPLVESLLDSLLLICRDETRLSLSLIRIDHQSEFGLF